MNNGAVAEATPTIRTIVRHDLLSSIVVFLVALPLCMGIAIASGAPPAAGLITGIIGGIVVGLLSGAPLQVSGPAAGLSVMIYEIIQRESYEVMALAVIIGGAVQITAGVLRFGQWFRAVSPAVIRGMLTGIGVLIFAGQFHVMVDDDPRATGLKNILSLPEAVWKGVRPTDDASHHWAAMVGLITLLVILLWRGLARGRLKVVPAPLLAVVLGTGVAAVFNLPVNLVSIPDNLLEAVQLPGSESFARLLDGQVLLAGVAIAFVASAETLLCATAVDQLHRGPRTRYDKELRAQGIGNLICGVLGALPMTGVIVRSAANVEAGARSRASAVLHGFWLVLFVAALPFVLRMMPTAALAAVLVYTGYKLIDFKGARQLASFGRGELAIFIITVVMIVVADLLTGVLVGVGVSAARLLYQMSHLQIRSEQDEANNRTTLFLRGAATFVCLPRLAAALEQVLPNRELHVHFERLDYIDHACLDLIMNWEKQHESTGGRLVLDWEYLTARFRRADEPAAGPSPNGDRPQTELGPAAGVSNRPALDG
jgi:MFS superfamily sulfate permease-like transporter